MDFNDPQVIRIAWIISNSVALIMLWASWEKPVVGRILFFLLFVWASWVNGNGALKTPEIYLDYSRYTFLPFYKDFILGFFSRHSTPIVFAIAVCQFFIGISMLLKGNLFRLGCIGGMVFLVSIAPLGVGSGFPCSLIMAAGLLLLYRKGGGTIIEAFNGGRKPD